MISLPTCPMFGNPCRHCSTEIAIREFTEIKKDPRTGLFIPIRMGKHKATLGEFCNDAGQYIEEMHFCPVIWGNAQLPRYLHKVKINHAGTKKKHIVRKKVKTTKCKKPNAKKIKWKTRKDGPPNKTQEILHIGQQKLRL